MAAAGQKSRCPEKRPRLPGIRLLLELASQYEQPSSLKFNVPAILIVSFRVQKSSWATSALITCQLSFLQKQLSSFWDLKPLHLRPPLGTYLCMHIKGAGLLLLRHVLESSFQFYSPFLNNIIKYNMFLKFFYLFPVPVSLRPSLLAWSLVLAGEVRILHNGISDKQQIVS